MEVAVDEDGGVVNSPLILEVMMTEGFTLENLKALLVMNRTMQRPHMMVFGHCSKCHRSVTNHVTMYRDGDAPLDALEYFFRTLEEDCSFRVYDQQVLKDAASMLRSAAYRLERASKLTGDRQRSNVSEVRNILNAVEARIN